jgi:hypothetical protein
MKGVLVEEILPAPLNQLLTKHLVITLDQRFERHKLNVTA